MKTEDETKDKHTQGDWRYEIYQDSQDTRAARIWINRPETESCKANPDICHVYAIGDDGRPGGEMEANALLIAAAPSLLTALQGLLATCELNTDEMEDETRTAIRAAQDAVRNARGEA